MIKLFLDKIGCGESHVINLKKDDFFSFTIFLYKVHLSIKKGETSFSKNKYIEKFEMILPLEEKTLRVEEFLEDGAILSEIEISSENKKTSFLIKDEIMFYRDIRLLSGVEQEVLVVVL